MRFSIKTVAGKQEVKDYQVHGDNVDRDRALRELEKRGEDVITVSEEDVNSDGYAIRRRPFGRQRR